MRAFSKSSDKLSRVMNWDILIAVVVAALTAALVSVEIIRLQYEKPNIEINLIEVRFDSSIRGGRIVEQVTKIEFNYGAVTGFRLQRLLNTAMRLDWSDEVAVVAFGQELHRQTKFFDAPFRGELSERGVCFENGTVIWLDCVLVDAPDRTTFAKIPPGFDDGTCKRVAWDERTRWMTLPDEASIGGQTCDFFNVREDPQARVFFPKEIVSYFRASGIREPGKLRRAALDIYRPRSDVQESDRRDIARALRNVRQEILDLLQAAGAASIDRLVLELSARNKSSAANVLLKDALLRVCRDKTDCEEIELQMTGAERIEGRAAKRVVLSSPYLEPFEIEYINQALALDYQAVIAMADVHGELTV